MVQWVQGIPIPLELEEVLSWQCWSITFVPSSWVETPPKLKLFGKICFFSTHATAVGAITSLSLAAIDTALWDLKGRQTGLPLHILAGGAQEKVPVYTTEGGWLHKTTEELIIEANDAKNKGFFGTKIKVGKPHVSEDTSRLIAVRKALGPSFEIMVDANQAFSVSEAIRRAKSWENIDLAWFEEPLPAEDMNGHVRLSQSTSTPIAVGESIYHPSHFREYLQAGACSIVQVDVARVGGITPWLKTAHLAECFNVQVCPHFLMELHIGLCCAIPNARWLEYIPQLDIVTKTKMKIENGYAYPSSEPGLGIDWDFQALKSHSIATVSLKHNA